MRPIRLLLADDHALVLQAVRFALEPEPEIEIVGEARSGSEVLPRVAETTPDRGCSFFLPTSKFRLWQFSAPREQNSGNLSGFMPSPEELAREKIDKC